MKRAAAWLFQTKLAPGLGFLRSSVAGAGGLHKLTNRGDSRDDLAQLELVKDSCFTSCIWSHLHKAPARSDAFPYRCNALLQR